MEIIKLNESLLTKTITLRDEIFKGLTKIEKETLTASLYPDVKWYKKAEIEQLNYWVSIDEDENVIGIIGLYTEVGDKPSNVWLGWYGIKKSYRGKHLGSKLLDFITNIAKEQGFKELHLYTTSYKENEDAVKLYERRGFTLYKEEKKSKTLYYKLKL